VGASLDTLAELIEERLVPGADTEEIDRRINAMFGERWCVLFTDMAGFSRRSAQSGIIPFLVLIHRLEKLGKPIVHKNAGFILKRIADSWMVLFRDPKAALRTCVELQRAIHRHNVGCSKQDQLYLGCGIGYGDVLKLGDEDMFGVEVNFSSKLGEDVAGPYEVLLTPDAVAAVGRVRGVTFRKVKGGRLGGTKLPYYEALYDVGGADQRASAKRDRVRFGKHGARAADGGAAPRAAGAASGARKRKR